MLTEDRQHPLPSIYQFSKYRDYLNAVLLPNGNYSRSEPLEVLAKKLGYKTPSSLSLVLNGKRLPTSTFLDNFAEAYKLKGEEREYLSTLVKLESALAKGEDTTLHLEKLSKFSGVKGTHQLGLKTFKKVSKWYFMAIRYLVSLPGQKQDIESLEKALKYRVRPSQIAEAIEILLDLNFLSRDEDGTLKDYIGPTRTEEGVTSFAIRKFHAGMIQEAMHSLENEETSQRYITGLTVTFDERDDQEAIKDIQDFVEFFIAKYGKLENATQVRQLNMQLFTLANSQKEKTQ